MNEVPADLEAGERPVCLSELLWLVSTFAGTIGIDSQWVEEHRSFRMLAQAFVEAVKNAFISIPLCCVKNKNIVWMSIGTLGKFQKIAKKSGYVSTVFGDMRTLLKRKYGCQDN